MRKNFQTACSLIILLCLLSTAENFSQSGQINFNSPENILKFADYLFCEKDYLRAIDEYNRYLKQEQKDTIIFKLALSNSRIGNNSTAFDLYNKLLQDKSFEDIVRLEIAKLNFRNKDFSELDKIAGEQDFQKSKYYPSIRILNYLLFLYYNQNINIDPEGFVEIFPENSRQNMKEFYERKINPPYKKPVLAAILSTVIPGAGKIYTGHYGDGITAFILTGLLSYTSYSNFNAGHDFRGWLFAGLGGIFYLGNIYGSAVSAQIRNTEIDLQLKIDLDNFLSQQNYFMPDDEYFCK